MPITVRYQPPKQKVNDKLIQHSDNKTSQSGEDGIISEIFKILDSHSEEKADDIKWCIEFGCWDGLHLSNTYHLIKECGWNGVLIEGNSEKFQQLIHNYKNEISDKRVYCCNEMVGFGPHSTVSELFPNQYHSKAFLSRNCPEKYRDLDSILSSDVSVVDKDFDLLCIDVDGCDYHIWDSITKYTPKLVIIEFNPTIPNHIIFIQDRDISMQQGSSLAAIIALAKSKGYELICTTTYNAFFIRRQYFTLFYPNNEVESEANIESEIDSILESDSDATKTDNLSINRMSSTVSTVSPTSLSTSLSQPSLEAAAVNSIYKMHDPPMTTEFFQLYDGTIMLTGCKKLLWHKIGIDFNQIQVLPKEKRVFPFAAEQPPTFHKNLKPKATPPKQTKNKKKSGNKQKSKAKYGIVNKKMIGGACAVTFGLGVGCGWLYAKYPLFTSNSGNKVSN